MKADEGGTLQKGRAKGHASRDAATASFVADGHCTSGVVDGRPL